MHDTLCNNKEEKIRGVHIVAALRPNCVKEMMQKVIRRNDVNQSCFTGDKPHFCEKNGIVKT